MSHRVASRLGVFLFLIYVFGDGLAFFLDSSTPAPNGGEQYLTSRHFLQIMDMLYEEKQARHQLEQTVLALQGKLDSYNHHCYGQTLNVSEFIQPYISRQQNQESELVLLRKTYENSLRTKENELNLLRDKITQLEQNYTSLIHDTDNIKTDNQILKNDIASLQIDKGVAVAIKLQEISKELNLLKFNSQARSQDFLALYNLTMSYKAAINDGLNKLIHADKLGFTACDGYITGLLIKFRTVMFVNGITMNSTYRDGMFYAPEKGFYFVTVNVLIDGEHGCYIWHNNKYISWSWSHFTGSTNGYHAASTSAFMKLEIGDTVSIKADASLLINPGSCLTIFKL